MLPIKRQCIGDGIQTNQTFSQRSPYQRTTKTRLCHSYTPTQLSTDLASGASQTQDTSQLEATGTNEDPFIKNNHANSNEDGELLEAASMRLPVKGVEEIPATRSSGSINLKSSHRATYCFGMVSHHPPTFGFSKANHLLRYLETLTCFRNQKPPRTYYFVSAVK